MRTLTGGYNDPVNYVDLLGLSAGAIALRGLGSRFVPGLGQALLLIDIYNHANERNEARQAYLDAGGHWKDLQPKSKPMIEMKPDGSVGFNLDLTFPPTNEEIKQRTNELLKKPLASSNINIDVDRMIKDAINPKSGREQKNEPEPANKQGPDPEPKVPIPPLGDDDDDDGRIWVSHYTTKERAAAIMAAGVLKPGFGETYVCVMEEPSTPEDAVEAGALNTDAKVVFKAYRNLELDKDYGLSDYNHTKALNFIYPGPVSLKNRKPRIEYPIKKKNLWEKFKDLLDGNKSNQCEGK